MNYNIKYMRRALQLAAKSPFDTHPNPMVGAVIVCGDQIIGEGWHRRCGQGHAEVNAIASVANKMLLRNSTIYVTLEPCSHYGKTPPCAKLIIDSGIPRVVVGAVDPFEKVAGRGISMLREAGVEVVSGILADESRALNRRFFTAHTLHRPYITLKWAQTANGYMASANTRLQISSPATLPLVHRERALNDAILTTVDTFLADRPRLNTRLWEGPSPRRFIASRSSSRLEQIAPQAEGFTLIEAADAAEIFAQLYSQGVTSVLVEAGPRFLSTLLSHNLFDELRVETSSTMVSASGETPEAFTSAPAIPADANRCNTLEIAGNRIDSYFRCN